MASDLQTATAHIATAYFGATPVPTSAVASVIRGIAETVRMLKAGPEADETRADVIQEGHTIPSVSPKRSVFNDYIRCLECGRKFTTIRRHVREAHGMEPLDYRAKWSLPVTYPMTAPAYSARRSTMAKDAGLGRSPTARASRQRAKA